VAQNSLKFGTSGLRGLAVELEGQAARRYTSAFLQHLVNIGQSGAGQVYLGRDFRASSPTILTDCAVAIARSGLEPVDCGAIPTPALALHAMAAGCPAIMVTGSHIPADRNGLKFYAPRGEISKADEAGILGALRATDIADAAPVLVDESHEATERYFARCAAIVAAGALTGLRIGVFEHSSVARDLLGRVLRHAGAEVVSLGRSDAFVAVDTEAFSDAVLAPLKDWVRDKKLDLLVSADGDGDRPLMMDARSAFVRGDVLGLLTAQYLGAQTVVTPVTSNSGIERTGYFKKVIRTRVGSPFVVAAMEQAPDGVVGFEANGGTFVGAAISVQGQPLKALPTRDAVLPLLCTTALAVLRGVTVDQLVAELPLQIAMADRLQDVAASKSADFLTRLVEEDGFAAGVFEPHGIASVSVTDGVQFHTASGDMVHFRASGNAPELRCYVEGRTSEIARSLLDWAMGVAAENVR
tara:strand:+ start:4195 stop:5598 length:1404 start_codon:yes stop_codon:yes gene_type:complete